MSTIEIAKQQKIINGKDFLTLAELSSSAIAKLLQLAIDIKANFKQVKSMHH